MGNLVAVPLGAVVELVNEYSTVSRATAGELNETPDRPADASLVKCSTHELSRIADGLYPVFAATSSAESATALNSILLGQLCIPQLDPCAPQAPLRWHTTGPVEARLLACCAVALLGAVNGGARLGLCSAQRCADVYVDSGRGHPRKFCSGVCQNRAKVASFRARRSEPAGP